jgi:Zn finger protein HypA/HybF involved in hydrogenase expression
MLKKNKWSDSVIDNIWWEVHESAINSLPVFRKKFIQKFIHNELATNARQHLYYNYKYSTCRKCTTELETQEHIIKCTGCTVRISLQQKYLLNLNCILEKHRINQATKTLICHNVGNWLQNIDPENAKTIAPDATKNLVKANEEQKKISWGHWVKGRWSKEWGALFNYDIKNNNSGIKFNSAEKVAKEMIILTWEFVHDCWLTRNKLEHDTDGDPETRKKEKVIEIILGESENTNYETYKKMELENDTLIRLPLENLQMLEINIKNEKKRRRTEKKKMLPG